MEKQCTLCGIVVNDENCVKYINKRNGNKYFNSRCKLCSNKDFRERQLIQRNKLDDKYVAKKLKEKGHIKPSKDLIQVSKLLIKLKRMINVKEKQNLL